MTRKLQFLLTALLLMVGATSAWAKIVWPTKAILYQSNNAPSTANAWSDGYPQDVLSAATIDINKADNRWTIVEFQIPRSSSISSINISTYYSNKDCLSDVKVYAFPYEMPGASDSWPADFGTNVNSAITSTALATISKPSGAAVSSANITTTNLSTTFASYISEDDVLTLRLVLWSEYRTIISSTGNSVPNRRLFLNVSYSDIAHPIYIGETHYDDLATAAKAASDDDVLLLYDDCFLTSRLLFKNQDGYVKNSVTFKAAEGKDVTIYRWSDFTDITFLCSYAKTITFDGSNSGASLTIDACNSAKADKVLFGNESSGTFSFKNVTVKNYNSVGPAVMQVNSGKTGSYVLENVTFENCSPSTAIINSLTTNSEKIVLKGDLTFTNCTGTHISLAKYMKEDSFTPTAAITLAWSETKANNTEVVSNANKANLSKYLLSDGWQLFYDNGTMKMQYDPEASVGETYYSRLSDAIADAAESSTVKILRDMTIPARLQIKKNLTIEPNEAGITVAVPGTFTGDYNAIEMATSDKTLTIGSDTYAMTIDGQRTSLGSTIIDANTVYRKLIECTNGQIDLKNLTFKDVYTSCNQGVVCGKTNGTISLSDVVFDGCQSDHATQPCIVFCGKNDGIVLKNNNQFTNCTADLAGTYKNCNIFLERRVSIDASISNTTPIRLYAKESNIALGNPVATNSLPADEARFFILNKDYACYSKSDDSSRKDLTICEGKTLDVSDAEAATLVLPFAATIPEGVTCYTLKHTDGASTVTASEVTGGTLAAQRPVLINAAKGSYKFKNSSNATTATSIPESPSVFEALTGVYTANTFVTTTPGDNELAINNHYILNKIDDNVGFYKAAEGKKVGANRCYLTATDVPGESTARGIRIVFDEEVTGVSEVSAKKPVMEDGIYYNLSGQRVAQPTRGLYIVNGKKVFIK